MVVVPNSRTVKDVDLWFATMNRRPAVVADTSGNVTMDEAFDASMIHSRVSVGSSGKSPDDQTPTPVMFWKVLFFATVDPVPPLLTGNVPEMSATGTDAEPVSAAVPVPLT